MVKDFFDIRYLLNGSEVQKSGYNALISIDIFDILHEFNPVLAGTLPLDIFIKGSDLDIICNVADLAAFEKIMITYFSKYANFEIDIKEVKGINSIISRFHTQDFEFEIFGQPIPTHYQLAFRHLLIEDKILQMKDEAFKSKIIGLKLAGLKTEPAFAQLLNLHGDPYESLLNVPV